MINGLLFKIAKGPFMGKIVGNAFRYCGWAIPVKKVYSSKKIIAFYHPKPSYENHIIISPKRAVRNLQQMASEEYSAYFFRAWEAVNCIRAMRPEYNCSFAVVANGGKRQEVQQVHFHLFTNREIVNEYSVQRQEGEVFYKDIDVCILKHPNPNWEAHFVAVPVSLSQMAGSEEYKYKYFRSVLHSIDLLNDEFNIVRGGYSLVYQYKQSNDDKDCPVFHIVSGRKLK